MPFFKSFRQELNGNALMSHLASACQRFVQDPALGKTHLSAALKAWAEVKASKAEIALCSKGWKYVVNIREELIPAVVPFGGTSALTDLDFIHSSASQWYEEARLRE